MTKLFVFLSVMLLNGPAWALGWAYEGGGFWLHMDAGGVGDPGSAGNVRVAIFKVDSSMVVGAESADGQHCYEIEILTRDKNDVLLLGSQEGVLYCEKTKGSPLSEALFSRVPIKGDNKKFLCVKNCGARTPKVFRLKYDEPD